MGPRLVVFADPHIKIGLQLGNGTVHLFAERDAIKLIEHGLAEALADTIGWLFVLVRGRRIDLAMTPIDWPRAFNRPICPLSSSDKCE